MSCDSDACLIVDIPGPKGATGPAGINGTNGKNAYSLTGASFVMPAELGTVSVTVDTSWMVIYQYVQAGDVGSGATGTFQVVGITSSSVAVLKNVADTANGKYPDNSPPGTAFPLASRVSPTGSEGPRGQDGISGAPTDATYIVQTPSGSLSAEQALSSLSTGVMKSTTVTGVVSTIPIGVANANIALVDDAAGLTAGETLFATASGIESKTAAAARSALGLAGMATQNPAAVAITGGSANNLVIGGTTPAAGSFTALSASTRFSTIASAQQNLLAADQITVNAPKLRVAGSGGAVTLTSVPTIPTGSVNGQLLLVQGMSDTNTVTVQDNGTLAGSLLRLGANTRLLTAGDTLLLSWDSDLGVWIEVSFTALV